MVATATPKLEITLPIMHAHDVAGCDLIVCWRHNWPECPLEVVEVSEVLSDQQSAFSQSHSPQINADER